MNRIIIKNGFVLFFLRVWVRIFISSKNSYNYNHTVEWKSSRLYKLIAGGPQISYYLRVSKRVKVGGYGIPIHYGLYPFIKIGRRKSRYVCGTGTYSHDRKDFAFERTAANIVCPSAAVPQESVSVPPLQLFT
jgi:hypothetical protein